jgi:hypothetical protein
MEMLSDVCKVPGLLHGPLAADQRTHQNVTGTGPPCEDCYGLAAPSAGLLEDICTTAWVQPALQLAALQARSDCVVEQYKKLHFNQSTTQSQTATVVHYKPTH